MSDGEITIKKENIIYNLNANNTDDVIKALSRLMYKNGDIRDLNIFQEVVIERENQIPTSLGNDVAIPHGKSDSVLESGVAFAKLKEKIKWGDENEDDVRYVFLLAVRETDKGNEHLRMLANLSSSLMDDKFLEKIRSSNNVNDLYEAINN